MSDPASPSAVPEVIRTQLGTPDAVITSGADGRLLVVADHETPASVVDALLAAAPALRDTGAGELAADPSS